MCLFVVRSSVPSSAIIIFIESNLFQFFHHIFNGVNVLYIALVSSSQSRHSLQGMHISSSLSIYSWFLSFYAHRICIIYMARDSYFIFFRLLFNIINIMILFIWARELMNDSHKMKNVCKVRCFFISYLRIILK